MQSPKDYFPLLVLTIIASFNFDVDIYGPKWALLLGACVIIIAIWFSKISLLAASWLCWTLFSSLYVFAWRDNMYFNVPFPVELNSAFAAFSLLAMSLAVVTLNPVNIRRIAYGFGLLGFVSSVLIILHFLRGKTTSLSTGGFFDQGSMEGVFIACTYPLLTMIYWGFGFATNLVVSTIPIAAVVVLAWKGQASQPIVLMGIAFGLHYCFESTYLKKHSPLLCCIGLLSFAIFVWVGNALNPQFFDSAGRTPIYKMAWEFLMDPKMSVYNGTTLETLQLTPWAWLVGLGNGTWFTMGRVIQELTNTHRGSGFLWLHSDWMQIWWETGLIGFGLAIATGIQGVYRGLSSGGVGYAYGVALFVYGAAMVFQFPMHMALHSFLGIYLLFVCLSLRSR